MTRSAARELAVHRVFAMNLNPESPGDALDFAFEPSYYAKYKDIEELAELYAGFPETPQYDYIAAILTGVCGKLEEIDAIIAKYSADREVKRISGVARAALRVCVFELLNMTEIPVSAAISEAVYMLECYEDEKTVKFVNGILGTFSREIDNR
ncbi:MAG: transcription antitermination factor NusB [Oscillospiraceae bacterium]|jgi:N utilization substance protein B|nr:transcription antitermination factor NusB [Oscillospiraceae bacterium]